ncbi:MAG: hypothetical protein ACKVVO_03450 [Opitutaceae bacterium]
MALITTLFVFAVVAIGWVVVSRLYEPTSTSPQNAVAENLPKELAWKATPATRKQALGELREKHAQQSTSYAWIDKNAGVVQLPIERAMQLTAAHYGSKK